MPIIDATLNTHDDEKVVRLVSTEGVEFEVSYGSIKQSRTLCSFLNSQLNWTEADDCTLHLLGMSTHTVSRVAEFLNGREGFMGEASLVQAFSMEPEECLELLLVADYLEI